LEDGALLLQLRVLHLGLLVDGDVGVGVFPEREKILVCRAALRNVALECIGTTQLEVRQRTDRFVEHEPAMVEDFLKLCSGFAAPMCSQIGFFAHINRV